MDTVPLIARNTVTAYLLPGERERIQTVRYGERICYAPVVQSASAGRVEYRLDGVPLADDALVYGGAVLLPPEEKSFSERLWDRLFGDNG